MEKADAREGHRDTVFVAGHDDMIIAHRTTGLCDELHTALVGALDIVAEGEEGVRAKCHLRILGNPGLFLFHR